MSATLKVRLNDGSFALINKRDARLVLPHNWSISKRKNNAYACSRISGRTVWMHRLILEIVGSGRKIQADHKNHNGLDNRRRNLRVATVGQNSAHSRFQNNKTGFRGVVANCGKFYDKSARALFGEFAVTNF